LFQECVPGEGSISLVVKGDQLGLARLEMDWVAEAEDVWQVSLQSPMGDILLDLSRYPQESVRKLGPLSKKLKALQFSENSVFWDEKKLPFTATDLFCFVSAHYPRSWLEGADTFIQDGVIKAESGKIVFRFDDEKWPVCAQVRRSIAWVFSREIYRVCLDPLRRRGVFAAGDVTLEWMIAE
jgi:hypothetical protein